MTFKNKQKLFSKKKTNFLKVNLQIHACLRRNCKLFLIITVWKYSKFKDLLHTLDVDQIPAKEHKGVDRWAADEVSAL